MNGDGEMNLGGREAETAEERQPARSDIGSDPATLATVDFAQAAEMVSEENSDRCLVPTEEGGVDSTHETNGSLRGVGTAAGMASEDDSERGGGVVSAAELLGGQAADDEPRATLQPTTPRGGTRPTGIGSDYARRKGMVWREVWEAWGELRAQARAQGRELSRREAAELLGVGHVTLWRMERDYAKRGFEARTDGCGRSSQWEYLVRDYLTAKNRPGGRPPSAEQAFQSKLREIYLATVGAGSANMTRGRRTAKMALAMQSMAEEPECPKELAARLRRGKYPVCLLRFLKRITPELENRLRGPKHFQLNGLNSRRDQTIRFEDGTRGEMPAGFKWVFDDMSSNQPFYAVMGKEGAAPAAQVLFSRQGLYAIDERSLRWLGKMLVARPREAYRAEDILRFLRSLMQVYGKPDLIVFELSVWASRKIRGFRITETQAVIEEEFDRPEMVATERQELQQGLEAIGVRLLFAHSAHGKIIETAFNYLQDVLAVKTREFVNVGRHAGEFESSAKRVRQVRSGRGPGELGFAEMSELSERIDQAFGFINGRANSRGEVPDEVWSADCGCGTCTDEHGRTRTDTGKRPLPELQPDDYAAFLTETRERSIDGGRVTCEVDGCKHDFRAPWMIELGSGFRVYLKFDPMEPTLGAAVYSRETGPANIHGWKRGKFIGWAVWEMPGPAADVIGNVRGVERGPVEEFYGPGAFDNGDNLRRKQNKVVATAFSALPRPGQPAVKNVKSVGSEERGSAENSQSPIANSQNPNRLRTFVRPSEEERKDRVNSFARLAAIARSQETEPNYQEHES